MRLVLVTALSVCAGAAFALHSARPAAAADRPNIVWIVSEDNGPFLGCYGDELADTPNIDALAKVGILYQNAFANAPVCAPARSVLASGIYGPSMGTQHMRSRNRIPASIRYMSQYLRDVGYYCTNRSKTDYNMSTPSGVWDESSGKGHFRNRPKKDQPFFAIFNIGTSHESSVHRVGTPKHDPAKMKIPPYHPDTPEVRKDWAWYYDKIQAMDGYVGGIIKQIKDDGLWDNTIVFYYADHGGVITRSKRFLYDSGTHVPLIVRFPEKYQKLATHKPGEQTDRLVSFVDFGPTVLSLAGIDIPGNMQGEAFLGTQQKPERDYVYLFRGRMDERYDMMRAVRDKKFKYIRNFKPHRIYGQHLNYLWKMQTTRTWEKLFKEGKCNEVQSYFWQPKPTEELYDTSKDPHEVNNLAKDPKYADVLKRMRAETHKWSLSIYDSGFMPEGMMLDRAGSKTIYEYIRSDDYPLERIMETAYMASDRDADVLAELSKRLKDKDPAVRYWAATGFLIRAKDAKARAAAAALDAVLQDPHGDTQIVAAEALCKMGMTDKGYAVLRRNLANDKLNASAMLHAVNTAQVLASKDLIPAVEGIKNNRGYVARASGWFMESIAEKKPAPPQKRKPKKKSKK